MPRLAGIAWGWPSVLLGMPLLVAGVLCAFPTLRPAACLWLLGLALPAFLTLGLLHVWLAVQRGGEEPVSLWWAQVLPPALFLCGLAGLGRPVVARAHHRLQRWRRRRRFRRLYP